MANSQLTSATAFSPSLEAIKLAASMYNAAREGNKKALETAVLEGMPPNLTNEKGDTLVSSPFGSWFCHILVYRRYQGCQTVSLVIQSTNFDVAAYAFGILRPRGLGEIPDRARRRPKQVK